MTRIAILWFLFFLCFQFCASDDSQSRVFTIGFLIEESQRHIRNDISITLNEIEEDTNHKLETEYVTINREESIETMNNLCKVLHNGVSIVVDMTYVVDNAIVDIINSNEIPYLKVSITIEPFLRVLERYLQARTKAVDVVFIFQNQQELNDAVLYVAKGLPFRTVLLNGLNEYFVKHFEEIHIIPSYYVIFANTNNMNEILQKLLNKDLFHLPQKWHLCFMDFDSNNFEHHNGVLSATKIAPNFNITCPLKNNDQCNHGNDVSLSKIMLEEVISTIISNSKILPHRTSSCVNNNVSNNKSLSLQNTNLRSKIEMSPLLQFTNEEVSFQLNLTMQIYTNRNTYNNTALWIKDELQQLSDNIKPPKRFYRIGTAMAEPWSFIIRDPKTNQPILDGKGEPIWTGYCVDLIENLAKKMDFDYKLVIPKEGTIGKQLPNGKWDGLIGDLVSGETDIAVGAVKMTSDREEVVDFVTPYFEQTGISIVIRKPVRQASLFKFMTVLRLEVWFCIVGSLICTAILIWLLEKYSPYSSRNNKKAYSYRCREFTIKESFWFALTSFTPQGGGEAPKSISGRILISAYWLFVVLMLATFTANLAAFLTVERMQTPVQSLEQLARQSRINYTVVKDSDTHKFFMNMKHAEDMLYKMWKELTLNATDIFRYRIWDYPIKEQYGHILIAINGSQPVEDAAEGFRKVNEHEGADYAFIHDSAEIKYEISRNCNLTEVGEVFAEQPYAIALPQGSTLHDEITYAILEFQKQRVFENLLDKYWDRNRRKDCAQMDDNEGISLQSLGGIFIATIFGLALAIISLFVEINFYRKKEKEGKLSAIADSFNARNDNQEFSRRPPAILRKSEKTYDNIQQVTIGNRFVPQKRFQANISYISVQPRKPIHKLEYIE